MTAGGLDAGAFWCMNDTAVGSGRAPPSTRNPAMSKGLDKKKEDKKKPEKSLKEKRAAKAAKKASKG